MLASTMAARNSGVTKIIAADLHDSRLEMASEFGATHTINSRNGDLVEEVAKITGSTVDFAFDCTGVISVIETLAQTVGMLGTLVLIGSAPAGASFSLDHLSTLWGKRVIGVLGGGGRSELRGGRSCPGPGRGAGSGVGNSISCDFGASTASMHEPPACGGVGLELERTSSDINDSRGPGRNE